jgi:hypothetical protein
LNAINWPFTSCGDGTWDIQKVTFAVAPARNTNQLINTVIYWFKFKTGKAKSAITFKNVLLTVKLNGVQLRSETVVFTDAFENGDTVEFKFNNSISPFAPVGTYGLSFQFVDNHNKNNGCIAFQYKIWS